MRHKEPDFGELRSLLQQPPSEAVWRRLCAMTYPGCYAQSTERWLPYVEDLLDRSWPDALRVWDQRYLSTLNAPAAQLARAATIHSPTRKQLRGQIIPALLRQRPGLTALHMSVLRLDDALMRELLAALPASLRHLTLSQIEAATWAPLAAWDTLPHLETLRLGSVTLDTAPRRAILTALRARTLALHETRKIMLSQEGIIETLRESALPETLRALSLGNMLMSDVDARALGQLPWQQLERLELRDMEWTHIALHTLLEQPTMANLHTLALRYNTRDHGLVDALQRATPALRLRVLSLWCREQLPGFELARAMQTPAVRGIEELELSYLGAPESLGVLIGEGHNLTLRRLLVRYSHGAASTVCAMLQKAPWPALEEVELNLVGMDDASLTRLLDADLPALRALRLENPRGVARTSDYHPAAALLLRLPAARWFPQLDTLTFDPHHLTTDQHYSLLYHPDARPTLPANFTLPSTSEFRI
jgi:sulfur transfer complex TusBCD TusB component (DsrH family)